MGSDQFNFRRSRFPLHGFELPQCRIRLSSGNLEALVWCADKERRTWGGGATPKASPSAISGTVKVSALLCAKNRQRPLAAGRKQTLINQRSDQSSASVQRLAASAPALLRLLRLAASLCADPWLLGSGSCWTLRTRLCTGAAYAGQGRASKSWWLTVRLAWIFNIPACHCLPQ